MKPSLVPLLACPRCAGAMETVPAPQTAQTGEPDRLRCRTCRAEFPILAGVPRLLVDATVEESKTQALYGDIWHEFSASPPPSPRGYDAPATSHLELLELAAGWQLNAPGVGIDAGCGPGASVVSYARAHPESRVVGVDLADGIVLSAAAAASLPNADLVQANLLALPLARSRFDFVYSFGVLHHTRDPEAAFRLLLDALRPGGKITLFVYKDFSDFPVKRAMLAPVTLLRRVTTRFPPPVLRAIGRLGAPMVFVALTLPARALRRLGAERLTRHIPYGTFPHLQAIASSLEDRLGAPFEHRFSRADLEGWATRAGLAEPRVVDCLPFGFSGLVLAGRKGTEKGLAPASGLS